MLSVRLRNGCAFAFVSVSCGLYHKFCHWLMQQMRAKVSK